MLVWGLLGLLCFCIRFIKWAVFLSFTPLYCFRFRACVHKQVAEAEYLVRSHGTASVREHAGVKSIGGSGRSGRVLHDHCQVPTRATLRNLLPGLLTCFSVSIWKGLLKVSVISL